MRSAPQKYTAKRLNGDLDRYPILCNFSQLLTSLSKTPSRDRSSSKLSPQVQGSNSLTSIKSCAALSFLFSSRAQHTNALHATSITALSLPTSHIRLCHHPTQRSHLASAARPAHGLTSQTLL